jgi:copper chaperone
MNLEKALFRIVRMYCLSCKPIVEKHLKNEDGIKKIDIDYMKERVVVDFDPVLITKEQIKKKLEKSGYKFVRTSNL